MTLLLAFIIGFCLGAIYVCREWENIVPVYQVFDYYDWLETHGFERDYDRPKRKCYPRRKGAIKKPRK